MNTTNLVIVCAIVCMRILTVKAQNLALVIDKCIKDPEMLASFSTMENQKSYLTLYQCWDQETLKYQVFPVQNCTAAGLAEEINKAYQFDVMDIGIVIVTDDCQKLVELENIFDREVIVYHVMAIVPAPCSGKDRFQHFEAIAIDVDLQPRPFPSSTIQHYEAIDEANLLIFIYDNSMPIKDVAEITLYFSSVNRLFEIKSLDDVSDEYLKYIAGMEHVSIYLSGTLDSTNAFLEQAKKYNLTKKKLTSWILFLKEPIPTIKSKLKLKIQYSSKVIIVQQKIVKPSFEIGSLLKSALEFSKAGSIPGYTCDICQYESSQIGVYRMVYEHNNPNAINLLCRASYDQWSRFLLVDGISSIWEPNNFMMTGIHFNIAVAFVEPSMMKNDSTSPPTYSGYYYDMLTMLQEKYNFTYNLYESEDKSYGLLENGNWTGLIGEVYSKRADIGWCALAQLIDRMEAVDYLDYPMTFQGYKLIFKSKLYNDRTGEWLTTYSKPFDFAVWLFILATMTLCSLGLTFIESNYVSESSTGKNENLKKIDCLRDGSNFFNNPFDNLLYMYSAIVQQGWDKTPDRISSRILVIFFRLFCLIMYAGYSAIIVSQYITETLVEPFQSLDDLLHKGKYPLVTLSNSSYYNFLMSHKNARTWMKKNDLVSSEEELLNKVLAEDYVGLYGENSVEFITSKNCSFHMIAEIYDKNFETAIMQKNSPYITAFTDEMRKLRHSGLMNRMWKKWHKSKTCARKSQDEKKIEQGSKTLTNTAFPFSAFVSGVIASVLAITIEFIIESYQNVIQNPES